MILELALIALPKPITVKQYHPTVQSIHLPQPPMERSYRPQVTPVSLGRYIVTPKAKESM